MKTINIANDFSVFPGGRYRSDGEFSGEEFRDNILIPALQKYQQVIVELDGTRGYGSSFLEEVFGGLVREGYDRKFIKAHLTLSSNREGLKKEIFSYIAKA